MGERSDEASALCGSRLAVTFVRFESSLCVGSHGSSERALGWEGAAAFALSSECDAPEFGESPPR